jgi:hypothetical protein
MSQEMAATMFYGSAANPEEFVGLSNRYVSTSDANGQNIILAGGAQSDNSSVWLVGWGLRTVHGIFPDGSTAGLVHEDLGVGDAFDSSNNRFRAYMDRYTWKCGLVVKDWRYAVRIANIDISTLIADPTGSTTNLLNYFLKAIHRLPSLQGIKPAFYANRTIKEMLDIQAMNKSNLLLNIGQEEGRAKLTFRGIPVRTCDALTESESVVS